jgi:hypothetical protein
VPRGSSVDDEVDVLVTRLVGPLFYRRYISRQPTSPELVSRLVRSALSPLGG